MFEDILQEERITWENGYYYCPYIPLQIIKTKIVEGKRKLEARWTMELKQDLMSDYMSDYDEIVDV